jgi:8-oxo-dGTP pyrophosphatase MutT (NUDIX family)
MPISPYLRALREKVGSDLLLVPSVTVLVFDPRGRVLLVRHAEGPWVAPGGSLEPAERPADAAVREAWEETGLTVELVHLLGVYAGPEFEVRYANGDRVAYCMSVFEGRRAGGDARPDGIETLELGWFSAEELAGLALPPWARIVLPDAFADRTRAHYQPPAWQPPR